MHDAQKNVQAILSYTAMNIGIKMQNFTGGFLSCQDRQ
jgi:hypothetical protein